MNRIIGFLSIGLAWNLLALSLPAEWKMHTIDNSSRGADGVRLADLNNDSLPDLVTGWEEGGRISVYTNPGPKSSKDLWPATTVGEVKSPEDAVFADLDGDGHLDVVSCCESKTRTVFVHWGSSNSAQWKTEAFPALEQKALWMFCTPMEIDRNHGTDLVLAAKGNGAQIGWLQAPENARDLSAWRWHPLAPVGWVMSIESVDMDGDGDLDILYSDRKSATRGVHWLEYDAAQESTQPWKRHTLGGTDREVMFLAQGDLNQDGLLDWAAAVRNGPITWFARQDKTGKNWMQHEVNMPANAGSGKGVAILDVDLDGRLDLAFTCEHAETKVGVGWLRAENAATASEWIHTEISGAALGIKFDLIQQIDLDQDGDLDLLTCEERNNLGVIWYENPTR